ASSDTSPDFNQQLGFVTEAEGFIFLSAFLTGRILCACNERIRFSEGDHAALDPCCPPVWLRPFSSDRSVHGHSWRRDTPSCPVWRAWSTTIWRIESLRCPYCLFIAHRCSIFCHCISSLSWLRLLRCISAAAGAGRSS